MSGDVRGVSSSTQPFLTQTNVQKALLVTAILVATVSIAAIAGGIIGLGSIGITALSSKTLLMTGGGLMALPTAYMIQKIVLRVKIRQMRAYNCQRIDRLCNQLRQPDCEGIEEASYLPIRSRMKIYGHYDHQLVLHMLKHCPQAKLQEMITIIQRDMSQQDYERVAKDFITEKLEVFKTMDRSELIRINYSPILYYQGELSNELVHFVVTKLKTEVQNPFDGTLGQLDAEGKRTGDRGPSIELPHGLVELVRRLPYDMSVLGQAHSQGDQLTRRDYEALVRRMYQSIDPARQDTDITHTEHNNSLVSTLLYYLSNNAFIVPVDKEDACKVCVPFGLLRHVKKEGASQTVESISAEEAKLVAHMRVIMTPEKMQYGAVDVPGPQYDVTLTYTITKGSSEADPCNVKIESSLQRVMDPDPVIEE